MNWDVFSSVGYVSVALWACVPVLWLLHLLTRSRLWLSHVAVVFALAAIVLANVNSQTYVSRIQVDRSEQIQEQMSRQALARQAAEDDRASEVADIRFAEDASGEFLDQGGLNDADRAYFESFDLDDKPEWMKEKRERSDDSGADADDFESLTGVTTQRDGIDVPVDFVDEQEEPILMSAADKLTADRLDSANLSASGWMLFLAVLFVLFDYVRRLNRYRQAYCPLPIPSAWADALTPRDPVAVRGTSPRRSLHDELRVITRRGEAFIYCTDDAAAASQAAGTMPRLPAGFWPLRVLAVGDDPKMDDDFVFETVWYGRNSFVVDCPDRAMALLEHLLWRLAQRRASRAHTRRAVHVIWDVAAPISEQTKQAFSTLGRAAGYTLLICPKSTPTKADL